MQLRPRPPAPGGIAAATGAVWLLLGAALVAALPAPSRGAPGSSPTAGHVSIDTVDADTIGTERDSAIAAHAARLDSLRERIAGARAELLRLRVEYRARIERLEGALRIDVPVTVGDGPEPAVVAGGDALERVAAIARRYYAGARVSVLGASSGPGPGCGSPEARRRAAAATRHLTGPGRLEPASVRRGGCRRIARPDSTASPAASAGAESIVVVLISSLPAQGS